MAKEQADQMVSFGPYRVDLEKVQLWRGVQEVRLTGKAFAVLRYCIEHPGQLVTKDDLFQAVWPQTVVSESTLASCIQELRQALRDDAKKPRYIETMHRRGYRFIASVTTITPVASSQYSVASSLPSPAPNTQPLAPTLMGREAEFTQLHGWLEKAVSGERQIVFVTGEPGIGKTALVDAFLARFAYEHEHEHELRIGRGQCIEHYGAGEPYLPVLEALGRLCREPEGSQLIDLLAQHAPTWLVQMPALLKDTELERLQRKTAGTTRERMLRELAEALEILTAARPFVLWLEDLHWSDPSTLDLLAFVARRRERVRLLIIGSYRPVDVIVSAHPLKAMKHELQLHGQCEEMALGPLSEAAVGEYLTVRLSVPERGLGEVTALQQLVRAIHRRTDGNPLFMVNVVDQLVALGTLRAGGEGDRSAALLAVVERNIPENLRQLIEQQLERLSPQDRRVLEVASVVGVEWSVSAVAVGVGREPDEVDEQGAELARREQFLRARGASEWPDGTVATRYSFQHALYQEVLYQRLPAGRRQRLHQRIGERVEQAYGNQAREIAAELAVHFERGRDYRKAVQYLQQAGQNAAQRSAHGEAITHFTRGLELLKTLPDTPDRTQQELRLQLALGGLLTATKGWAAPEVASVHTRARELCQQLGETPELFWALLGLFTFHRIRAEHETARELAEQGLRLAQNIHNPLFLVWAHLMLGNTLFHLGEFAQAREQWEAGNALYDPQQHRSGTWNDPGVSCLAYGAVGLWHLGYPDQALQRSQEALTLAQELSRPFSLVYALEFAAVVHLLRGERQVAQERAEAVMALSTEQGFAHWLVSGTLSRGQALAEQGEVDEGIAQIRQGWAAWQALGAELERPGLLALLAWAYGKEGKIEDGLTTLAEALTLVNKTGERCYEAELYRIKGELTLQQKNQRAIGNGQQATVTDPRSLTPDPQGEAEACFLKAIDIARRQQAKMWELRATVSLVRLWQQQGKQKEARQMLAEIYGWFTEGIDTVDLQEGRELLEELGH